MKRVPIGEFSRMTHLSIKTLRFQTDAAAEWRTEIGWPIFQARAR